MEFSRSFFEILVVVAVGAAALAAVVLPVLFAIDARRKKLW